MGSLLFKDRDAPFANYLEAMMILSSPDKKWVDIPSIITEFNTGAYVGIKHIPSYERHVPLKIFDISYLREVKGLKRFSIECPDADLSHFEHLDGQDLEFLTIGIPPIGMRSDDSVLIKDFSFVGRFQKLKFLRVLCEYGSNLSFGNQMFERMKMLNLVGKSNISVIDFSNFPNLQYLDVDPGKHDLTEAGLGKLSSLRGLTITGMTMNQDLKFLKDLKNLELLSIRYCNKLTHLPDLSELKKLRWVYFENCKNIKNLGSLANVPNLKVLKFFSAMGKEFEMDQLRILAKSNSLENINIFHDSYTKKTEKMIEELVGEKGKYYGTTLLIEDKGYIVYHSRDESIPEFEYNGEQCRGSLE